MSRKLFVPLLLLDQFMTSPRNVMLAYVDGSDLDGIADQLEARFRDFVSRRAWKAAEVSVVNMRQPRNPEDSPEDLPQWDLGLSLTLPNRGEKDEGWRDDVHATVDLLSVLNEEFGRDFVIAVHDRVRGFNEDVAYVASEPPDLEKIFFMIDAHRA
jgi:hypothetical protein